MCLYHPFDADGAVFYFWLTAAPSFQGLSLHVYQWHRLLFFVKCVRRHSLQFLAHTILQTLCTNLIRLFHFILSSPVALEMLHEARHVCDGDSSIDVTWLSHLLEDAIEYMNEAWFEYKNETWFSSAVICQWFIHARLYEWDMTHSCMHATWLIHARLSCMNESCLIHLLYRIFYINKTGRNGVCE